MPNFWNSRPTVIAGLTFALIGAFYVFQYQDSSYFTMPSSVSSSSDGVPGLEFELSQVALYPPTLLITLKNNHPSATYTVLTWDTPLDSSALNTGVFTLTDEETSEEVEQVDIQVNRKMPPAQDQLVTLEPGTDHTVELVLDKAWLPSKTPGKYKITAEGEFNGVWRKRKGDLTEDELYAYMDSQFSGKRFSTNDVVFETVKHQ